MDYAYDPDEIRNIVCSSLKSVKCEHHKRSIKYICIDQTCENLSRGNCKDCFKHNQICQKYVLLKKMFEQNKESNDSLWECQGYNTSYIDVNLLLHIPSTLLINQFAMQIVELKLKILQHSVSLYLQWFEGPKWVKQLHLIEQKKAAGDYYLKIKNLWQLNKQFNTQPNSQMNNSKSMYFIQSSEKQYRILAAFKQSPRRQRINSRGDFPKSNYKKQILNKLKQFQSVNDLNASNNFQIVVAAHNNAIKIFCQNSLRRYKLMYKLLGCYQIGHGIEFSDDLTITITDSSSKLYIWQISETGWRCSLIIGKDQLIDYRLNRDSVILIIRYQKYVTIYEYYSKVWVQRHVLTELGCNPTCMEISPDSSILIIGYDDFMVLMQKNEYNNWIVIQKLYQTVTGYYSLFYKDIKFDSESANHFISCTSNNIITIWEKQQCQLWLPKWKVNQQAYRSGIQSIKVFTISKGLLVIQTLNTIYIWRLCNNKWVGEVVEDKHYINNIFALDNSTIFVVSNQFYCLTAIHEESSD